MIACLKKGKFEWTEEASKSFKSLKTKLMPAPVPVVPDFSKIAFQSEK